MTIWQDIITALDHTERLQADLPYVAEQVLRIRPKAGGLSPLVFNAAQAELHKRSEEQKARTGRVRAIVLKARQMGISTYIAARYYKRTVATPACAPLLLVTRSGPQRTCSSS